jgi:pSer/pThr/pTyr-binding forkhead associated (FHA) protein
MRGDTEQEEYRITPESGKFCIGRDKHAQIADGFLRINNIAFPSGGNESNRYVSRQHAHIEWNSSEACYFLFADEGGIPPRNKTKVLTSAGQQIRLQSLQIGHKLHDGDQVVLGESALLLFNYLRNENG